MEWLKSFIREFKVFGVAMFILATVWVCAWSRRLEQQANRIQYWPAIEVKAQPGIEMATVSADVDALD